MKKEYTLSLPKERESDIRLSRRVTLSNDDPFLNLFVKNRQHLEEIESEFSSEEVSRSRIQSSIAN